MFKQIIYLLFCFIYLFPCPLSVQDSNAYRRFRTTRGDYFSSNNTVPIDTVAAIKDIDYVLTTIIGRPYQILDALQDNQNRIEADLRITSSDSSTASASALYKECRDVLASGGHYFIEANESRSREQQEAALKAGNETLTRAKALIEQARRYTHNLTLSRSKDYQQHSDKTIEIKIPSQFNIFVPGLQNVADMVNFLSTYHPIETAYVGLGFAGSGLASKLFLPANRVVSNKLAGGVKYMGEVSPLSAETLAGSRLEPVVKALDRPPNNLPLDKVIQQDAQILQGNASTNILANSRQVNLEGNIVGQNKIGLQFNKDGLHYNVEYPSESLAANTIQKHAQILANDAKSIFVAKTVPVGKSPYVFPGPTFKQPSPTLPAGVTASQEWLRLEREAANVLQRMEMESPGAHFFRRHGAQTTLKQQYIRATEGRAPDKIIDGKIYKVNSSRFLTHQDQLKAARRAEELFKKNGRSEFNFDMGREIIGEGYLKGGSKYVITPRVRAVFKNDKLYTLFPLLDAI